MSLPFRIRIVKANAAVVKVLMFRMVWSLLWLWLWHGTSNVIGIS